MSILDLLKPKERVSLPPRLMDDRTNDRDEDWKARHKATYEALRELSDLLHLEKNNARYGSLSFIWFMGTEDYIQSVGDVARAAIAKLKEH